MITGNIFSINLSELNDQRLSTTLPNRLFDAQKPIASALIDRVGPTDN